MLVRPAKFVLRQRAVEVGAHSHETHGSSCRRVLAKPNQIVLVRPQVVVRKQLECLDGPQIPLRRVLQLVEGLVCFGKGGGDGRGAAVAVKGVEAGVALRGSGEADGTF